MGKTEYWLCKWLSNAGIRNIIITQDDDTEQQIFFIDIGENHLSGISIDKQYAVWIHKSRIDALKHYKVIADYPVEKINEDIFNYILKRFALVLGRAGIISSKDGWREKIRANFIDDVHKLFVLIRKGGLSFWSIIKMFSEFSSAMTIMAMVKSAIDDLKTDCEKCSYRKQFDDTHNRDPEYYVGKFFKGKISGKLIRIRSHIGFNGDDPIFEVSDESFNLTKEDKKLGIYKYPLQIKLSVLLYDYEIATIGNHKSYPPPKFFHGECDKPLYRSVIDKFRKLYPDELDYSKLEYAINFYLENDFTVPQALRMLISNMELVEIGRKDECVKLEKNRKVFNEMTDPGIRSKIKILLENTMVHEYIGKYAINRNTGECHKIIGESVLIKEHYRIGYDRLLVSKNDLLEYYRISSKPGTNFIEGDHVEIWDKYKDEFPDFKNSKGQLIVRNINYNEIDEISVQVENKKTHTHRLIEPYKLKRFNRQTDEYHKSLKNHQSITRKRYNELLEKEKCYTKELDILNIKGEAYDRIKRVVMMHFYKGREFRHKHFLGAVKYETQSAALKILDIMEENK